MAPPSLLAPCVRWPSGGPGLVDGEAASSLPVSAEPSSVEHRQPAGFSLQFLRLQVEAQMGAAVAVKRGLGPEADWEDVGLQCFQASQGHRAAVGEVLRNRGLVCPGIDGLGRTPGVC